MLKWCCDLNVWVWFLQWEWCAWARSLLIEKWQATRWIDLVMGSAHGNNRQKNNRESRFIFHGAQGRTRTDTPCGGGFWVPCVYQFRHLGSGFGLLKNGIIKHQYLVSTNFCKKIKKHAWASGVISKNSGLWWEENECVTMARGLKPNSGMWKDGNFVWLCGMTRRTHRHWIEKVLHGLRLQLV